MNSLIFHNKILKHQIYSCFLTNNIFSIIKITDIFVTITPRKPNFLNIVIFLAALQLIFKQKISIKLSRINSTKKPFVIFHSSKKSVINVLKNIIFDFFFFNQSQLLTISHNIKTILFFSVHVLRFNTLHNYYRYLFNIPRARISFVTNNKNVNILKVFTSLFRIPF